MTFIGTRGLASVRKFVARTLVDTVEVRRMEWEHELNSETLVSGYDSGEVIYTGPARVRPTNGQNEVVGESVMHLRSARVNLLYDAPAIHRNDVIRVTESANPDLVDRWLQVTEVRLASQEGYKRVETISIAPSRQWIGGNVDGES